MHEMLRLRIERWSTAYVVGGQEKYVTGTGMVMVLQDKRR